MKFNAKLSQLVHVVGQILRLITPLKSGKLLLPYTNPCKQDGQKQYQADEPQKLFVLMMWEESDTWSKVYDENQNLVESSGYILNSTEVNYYENWLRHWAKN